MSLPCPWIKVEFPWPEVTEVSSFIFDVSRHFVHKLRRLSIEKRTTASLGQLQYIPTLSPYVSTPNVQVQSTIECVY